MNRFRGLWPIIFVVTILLFSFVIRLSYVLTVDVIPTSDMGDYDFRAMQLLIDNTFIKDGTQGATYRPPGYIVFLAGIYGIFGHNYKAVYLIQTLLSTSTLFILYLLTKRLLDRKTAIIALGLSSLYVSFIGYTGILLSESLFLFLFLLAVYLFILGLQKEQTRWFLISGFLFGAATLTRSIAMIIPFLLIGWWIWEKRKSLHQLEWKRLAALILLMGITIAPWTIRNYIEQKQVIMVDTISGLNLLIGNNGYTTKYTDVIFDVPAYQNAVLGKTDAERDQLMKKAALSWIKENKREFVMNSSDRLVQYLMDTRDWIGDIQNWQAIFMYSPKFNTYYHWLLMSLGIVGGLMAVIKRDRALLPLLIAGYFFAVLSIFYFQARYRLPAMPFVIILAAYLLSHLSNWDRKSGLLGTLVIVLILAMIKKSVDYNL